jgi:hypothetical protein
MSVELKTSGWPTPQTPTIKHDNTVWNVMLIGTEGCTARGDFSFPDLSSLSLILISTIDTLQLHCS